MESERALSLLAEHQRTITDLLVAAEAAVEEVPLPSDKLAQLRWNMIRALRNYQIFKHVELLDPMARHPDRNKALLATDMKNRCVAIGETYQDHVRRWTTQSAQLRADEYRAETAGVIGDIHAHLGREAFDARALLQGIGRTRGHQRGAGTRRP